MIGHDEYDFFLRKVIDNGDGTYTLGEEKNLEDDFVGLRYKSMSGLNLTGNPKGVYTESYAESDGSRVYVSQNTARESVELTLKLVFFCAAEGLDYGSQIVAMEENYHDFCDFIIGGLLIWRDTARQRRVLMYQSDKPTIDSDKFGDGIPYIEASFKFKNVLGESFSLGDDTIAKKLDVKQTDL